MGLSNYVSASSGHARELADSLTEEEITALAHTLRACGLHEWQTWCADRLHQIHDYVAATPSQRSRKKAWQDPQLRPLLVLAAITHCQRAHALLEALIENETILSVGGSYRDTTAHAGTVQNQLENMCIPEWPEAFELYCPSPFDS